MGAEELTGVGAEKLQRKLTRQTCLAAAAKGGLACWPGQDVSLLPARASHSPCLLQITLTHADVYDCVLRTHEANYMALLTALLHCI